MIVSGVVQEAAARVGLPNLMVSVFLGATSRQLRAGSDISGADGRFSIEIPQDARQGEVIDLRLTVSGPETEAGPGPELYVSEPRRSRSDANERFIVSIDAVVLEKHNLPTPQSPFDAASIGQGAMARSGALAAMEKDWAAVAKARVSARRAQRNRFDQEFREPFLREVSTRSQDVPDRQLLSLEGDASRSVAALNALAFDRGADRISTPENATDGGPRRTRYFLTDEQRARLAQIIAQSGTTLSASDMESVLRLGESNGDLPRPTALSAEDAALEKFLDQTFDERCASEALNPQEGEDGDGGNGSERTGGGINDLLKRTVADVDAPLRQLGARPGQGDVIGNIRSFALAPGPADVPAFYDFHQLNIAFDHVWREFLDDRIEPLAREIYTSVTDLGGDPVAVSNAGTGPMAALTAEADLIAAAGVAPPPRALYRQKLDDRVSSDRLNGGGIFADINAPVRDEFVPPVFPTEPRPDDEDGGIDLPGSDISNPAPDAGAAELPPRTLMDRLNRILRGPYAFTAFGADNKNSAINFGVTITYRQRWEPVSYQVGELVRTITLAPGESRSYTKKTRLTRKRAEKEIEKNTSIREDEFDTTTRSEAEIVRRAQAKTNFSLNAEGTYNFGIAQGDSTTSTNHDAETASDDTKKSFREAVIKASQEYRQERTLEISSESVFETEEVEKGEITNENKELTVSYLFFELQRRFRVSEQIHAAQPVVLVAQNLPSPNRIDEAFAIQHGWILKRALLDDKYEDVLTYLCGPMAGDKVAREALHAAMLKHGRIVDQLKDDLYAMKEQASEGYEALRRAVEARIREVQAENEDGFLADVAQTFVGNGQSPEAARMREDAARNHEQRAVEETKRLTLALQREVSAFTEATEKYTRAHKDYKEWQLRILDLLLHLKQNILHYMQAIWAYEHPDQRFLRLHMKTAPDFEAKADGATYDFVGDVDLTREVALPDGTLSLRKAVEFTFRPNLEVVQNARTLAEIADLDSLLGFKGNYMIFPLRQSNALTDYMLEPYIDAGFRLLDPDDRGNVSREDFARYICHLRDTLEDAAFETLRPALLARFRRLLLSEPVNGDEIVIPTGSTYIEALPGANPLLEDFKLAHRALDVLAAQEEVRAASIENLRRAARILEEDLDDPDIDARYLIEGAGAVHVGTPNLGGDTPDADE